MNDLDALKAEFKRAVISRDQPMSQFEAAKREAIAKVSESYRGELKKAAEACFLAEKAVRDAIDNSSSHPWEGRRVFRVHEETIWSRGTRSVRYEGIVEVVRQTSKFSENMTWRQPPLGTVIIRKIKKDGTAALSFYGGILGYIQDWQLIEDQS